MTETPADINATRRHWDQQAETYDAAKQRHDVYYRTLKACFARAVPAESRGRVLEVGCGTGQILASLNPQEGLGIDLSPRMIDIARRRFHDLPNVRFEVLTAAQSGAVAGGLFDAVISGDMLEHADDWRAAVSAMVAACAPGGLVVLATPNPRWTLPLWILEKLRLKMPEGPHRFVRARDIAGHLRSLACTVVACQTHLLLPLELAGLGPAISRLAQRLPLTNGLGVIQMVAARRPSP